MKSYNNLIQYQKNIFLKPKDHESALLQKYADLKMSERVNDLQNIVFSLVYNYKEEMNRYKIIVIEFVTIIKFVSQNGLSFCGEN